jgi:hypothetical protein
MSGGPSAERLVSSDMLSGRGPAQSLAEANRPPASVCMLREGSAGFMPMR